MEKEVLNEAEAARYCRLSIGSFRKAVKKGKIPPPPDLGVRRRIWHVEALKAVMLGEPPAKGGGQDDSDRREAAWQRRRENRAR